MLTAKIVLDALRITAKVCFWREDILYFKSTPNKKRQIFSSQSGFPWQHVQSP